MLLTDFTTYTMHRPPDTNLQRWPAPASPPSRTFRYATDQLWNVRYTPTRQRRSPTTARAGIATL
ncbi:hypothetical protein M407DRAFT_193386 [Tulasnella calospora MUT 4182]|uniref:Uncharacterized protein n=1 Tax=Tulasnella calospora MUT 4182 TaxID=1051891 RepID=A0A0C3L0L7_9AGAM|nr:hypothetical protein M407DRAFT_193386 [Tulasnella calospora MUT 4182]